MRTNMGRISARRISMTLCLSLAAALTACGGGDASDDSAAPTESAEAMNLRNQIKLPQPAPIAVTGTITVGWNAPTKSADGLNMADLAGFRIYYGTASGNYTASVDVPSATTLTHTISGLPTNTYYVVVKAYDSSDNESSASPEVSKAIR